MGSFESFDDGYGEAQTLSFTDRTEILSFLRQFGNDMADVADEIGRETEDNLRDLGPRLARAMAAKGDILPKDIPLIIESLRQEVTGGLSPDVVQGWIEEDEADMRTGQLVGRIPQDEELDDEFADVLAFTGPAMSVDELVGAQIAAIHEQAGILGLSDDEIAAAEAEVLADAEEMRREEAGDGGDAQEFRRAA